MFLGYASYAEFIIKKTQAPTNDNSSIAKKEEHEDNTTLINENTDDKKEETTPKVSPLKHFPAKKYSKISVILVILGVILFFTYSYWNTFKQKYEDKLLSSIIFKSVTTKGASPFTTKIEYNIPEQLIDSMYIMCIEANGDRSKRKLSKVNRKYTLLSFTPVKGYAN